MTFDDSFKPELVACFMKERAFGVKYIPVINWARSALRRSRKKTWSRY
jgi:hypothetical protein